MFRSFTRLASSLAATAALLGPAAALATADPIEGVWVPKGSYDIQIAVVNLPGTDQYRSVEIGGSSSCRHNSGGKVDRVGMTGFTVAPTAGTAGHYEGTNNVFDSDCTPTGSTTPVKITLNGTQMTRCRDTSCDVFFREADPSTDPIAGLWKGRTTTDIVERVGENTFRMVAMDGPLQCTSDNVARQGHVDFDVSPTATANVYTGGAPGYYYDPPGCGASGNVFNATVVLSADGQQLRMCANDEGEPAPQPAADGSLSGTKGCFNETRIARQPLGTDPRTGLWRLHGSSTMMLVHPFGGTLKAIDILGPTSCSDGRQVGQTEFSAQPDGSLSAPVRGSDCSVTGARPVTFTVHDPGTPQEICTGPGGTAPCRANPVAADASRADLCDAASCTHWDLVQLDAPQGPLIATGLPSGKSCVHKMVLQHFGAFHDLVYSAVVKVNGQLVAHLKGLGQIDKPVVYRPKHGRRFSVAIYAVTVTDRSLKLSRKLRGC